MALYLYIPASLLMLGYAFFPSQWLVAASYLLWGVVCTLFMIKYVIDKHKYKTYLLDNYSNLEARDIAWVDWLILLTIGHCLIYIISNQTYLTTPESTVMLYLDLFVCILSAIYLTWNVDHQEMMEENKEETENTLDQPQEWVKNVLDTRRVQSELYLNPNLTLTMLAEHTGISYKLLSRYFSSSNKNYNRYINELRIEYAKKLITESNGHANLTAIAEKCGYTNIYTFRRVFKDIVNCLPSQYRG